MTPARPSLCTPQRCVRPMRVPDQLLVAGLLSHTNASRPSSLCLPSSYRRRFGRPWQTRTTFRSSSACSFSISWYPFSKFEPLGEKKYLPRFTLFRHVLKTNFYQPTKVALSFRLDGGFLPEVEYPTKPFGVFMVVGSEFRGFHVRFRDVARGGIRIVRSKGVEYVTLARIRGAIYDVEFAGITRSISVHCLTRTTPSRAPRLSRIRISLRVALRAQSYHRTQRLSFV